jgi:uncharacterized repeat protein (TIGR03837 family)
MNTHRIWDIFCTVIDNHGDLGVCWRLARQLADAGQSVRLWVDDASALHWMAPDTLRAKLPNIQVLPWASAGDATLLASMSPADVWVEAFGCTLPEAFVAHAVDTRTQQPSWINLEYLSAESWVPRMHRLPSPVMSGPAKGWTKHFFYPGFTPDTGGLMRETGLIERQQAFESSGQRAAWRLKHAPALAPDGLLISLFCYEPTALPQLLTQLAGTPHHLLVTPGRPLAAVQQALKGMTVQPNWSALPYTDQDGFDEMLWACDLNFVRGEDSLVRALWAGQPFIWHIYPQDDNAHHDKLEAFLDWMHAPESLQKAHRVWNGVEVSELSMLTSHSLRNWTACVHGARQRLLKQKALVTQLGAFARDKGISASPSLHR